MLFLNPNGQLDNLLIPFPFSLVKIPFIYLLNLVINGRFENMQVSYQTNCEPDYVCTEPFVQIASNIEIHKKNIKSTEPRLITFSLFGLGLNFLVLIKRTPTSAPLLKIGIMGITHFLKYTYFYRQLGCLAFSLRFWPKIKQFSNCPASDRTFSFKTGDFCIIV